MLTSAVPFRTQRSDLRLPMSAAYRPESVLRFPGRFRYLRMPQTLHHPFLRLHSPGYRRFFLRSFSRNPALPTSQMPRLSQAPASLNPPASPDPDFCRINREFRNFLPDSTKYPEISDLPLPFCLLCVPPSPDGTETYRTWLWLFLRISCFQPMQPRRLPAHFPPLRSVLPGNSAESSTSNSISIPRTLRRPQKAAS